jgi:iron complex outermembrane receptor protein
MKDLAFRIFFTFIVFSAGAQQQDSILFYQKGNIAEKMFDVEEILVRPSCACVGQCSCAEMQADNYSENRFLCTDAILSKNGRIELMKRGNFAFEPVMNGMASDRLNLTIDGMKIFGACTDKMDPVTSYVEPNNMKSISVQHGSSGSMFGSSLGGSVNMETSGATINPSRPISGEVGVGFQSAAFGANGLFSINYSRAKWAVRANGVYRRFQNYRSGGGKTIDFTQFEKWNGAISAKYMPSDKDVVRLDVIIDEGYNIGYAALPMDVKYAKARIYGLTYQHYPSQKWVEKIEAKLYANTVEHAMDDTKRPNVIMHMDMPGWTKTFGGYLDGRFKTKKHSLIARLDGYHSNARAEMTMYPNNEAPMFMLTWPDVDKLDIGAFLQDNIKFNEKRSLSWNLRLEYLNTRVIDDFGVQQASVFNQDVSDADHRLLKNASISYMELLGKGFSTWLTIGYAERAPSTTEQYAFYIFNAYDGFDYIGSQGLKNEKAVQADLGFEFKHKRASVRATGFHYQMLDYILGGIDSTLDAMTIGANGVKVSRNLSSAFMTGGNLELSYSPLKFLSVSNTSSFTFGNTFENDPLPLVPPFKNVTAAKWTHKRGFVQLDCETSATQNRVNSEFGESKTPAYAILNLRAGYEFPFGKKRLTLNGGVENLLDTNYRSHLDWGGIARPGINGYLNVSFTF